MSDPRQLHPQARIQGMALGFLAGYADTLGFLALFGLFTAHVTGNFILIGAALADPALLSEKPGQAAAAPTTAAAPASAFLNFRAFPPRQRPLGRAASSNHKR